MTRKICMTIFISAGLLAILVPVLTAQARRHHHRHHHYQPRFEAAKNDSDCITGNDGKVTCLIGVYPKGRQRLLNSQLLAAPSDRRRADRSRSNREGGGGDDLGVVRAWQPLLIPTHVGDK